MQLRDDDFRAQVQQAEAAVSCGESCPHQQSAAEGTAGCPYRSGGRGDPRSGSGHRRGGGRNSRRRNRRSRTRAARSTGLRRTWSAHRLERRRQEALVATESATRQKLEQAVAEAERFRAQLASREDELNAAKAQLASREADLARARAALGSAKAELEAQNRQRAVLDSQELLLRADLNAKRAALKLARTNLGYTRIVAPEKGIVSERKVRPGQLVSPGTQVISLVQSEVWVQANYKETQVRHIHPGDPAEIRVDAFPGVSLRGKVEQLSPASGSQFALLPPDNATGNFTKIVQRIPVKILLDPARQSPVDCGPACR